VSDAAPSTGAAGEQPRIRQFTRRGVMRTTVAAGITFALPASAATLLAPAEAAAPNRLVLPRRPRRSGPSSSTLDPWS
jgi:hypothetical protein